MSKIFGLFTCFGSKKNKGEEGNRTIQDKQASASKNARVLPHFSPEDSAATCSRCGNALGIAIDNSASVDDIKKPQ